jgi:hypothetical protein
MKNNTNLISDTYIGSFGRWCIDLCLLSLIWFNSAVSVLSLFSSAFIIIFQTLNPPICFVPMPYSSLLLLQFDIVVLDNNVIG